jgi:hypothetical protein
MSMIVRARYGKLSMKKKYQRDRNWVEEWLNDWVDESVAQSAIWLIEVTGRFSGLVTEEVRNSYLMSEWQTKLSLKIVSFFFLTALWINCWVNWLLRELTSDLLDQ